MWEAIESNRWRSRGIVAAMLVLLLLLGAAVGAWVLPTQGVWLGALGALALWGGLLAAALRSGDRLVLASVRARQVSKDDAPTLVNVVEEMAIAAGRGRPPSVWVVEDDSANAFAVGRTDESAAIAVTSGLLARLDRDELQGVIAHEMAHIENRDVHFLTVATVLVGAIVLLSEVLLRAPLVSRRLARRNPALAIASFVLALLAPLFARLLWFACSRQREFLADATAARLTRYPEGLASALEKLSRPGARASEPSAALAPLCIVSPRSSALDGPFSTHPPLEKRIQVLRRMHGAGYRGYEVAYREVFGKGRRCIGMRTLAKEGRSVPQRGPSIEASTHEAAVTRAHEALELVAALSGRISLFCVCGVCIRVPADTAKETVPCPRCGESCVVSRPDSAQEESVLTAPDEPQRHRRSGGWELVECRCGRKTHLSPGHGAPVLRCRSCRREIELV